MNQVVMVLLIVSNSVSAFATDTSGKFFYKSLIDDEKFDGSDLGLTLFDGYLDGHIAFGNNKMFCSTTEVTRKQARVIVIKYMDSHPDIWNEPANKIIDDAMRIEFPCEDYGSLDVDPIQR